MSRIDRMVLDIGGPATFTSSTGLPASLSFAAMILTRLQRGRLDMTLPDGRTLRFTGKEPGPMAELIVHDLKFVRAVAARGDIGFAEAFMDGKVDSPDLPLLLEYFNANWEDVGPLGARRRDRALLRASCATCCARTRRRARSATSWRTTTSAMTSTQPGSTRR